VRRSEEMARLIVESDQPLDPKIELGISEAWSRLLEAVKAPTGPPTKKGRASKHGPQVDKPVMRSVTNTPTVASAK
jgi:hypothetical protein